MTKRHAPIERAFSPLRLRERGRGPGYADYCSDGTPITVRRPGLSPSWNSAIMRAPKAHETSWVSLGSYTDNATLKRFVTACRLAHAVCVPRQREHRQRWHRSV